MTPGLEHEDLYREADLEGQQNSQEGQRLLREIPAPGGWRMKDKPIICLEKIKVPDEKHTLLRKDKDTVSNHIHINIIFSFPVKFIGWS